MRALCWGNSRWGVRRLLSHINHLPRDSAYARSLSGVAAYWDENAELTASVLDELRRLTYYFLAVNGNNPEQPVTFPRPGEVAPEPETVSLSDFNTFLKE